jgi:hypothetical protein
MRGNRPVHTRLALDIADTDGLSPPHNLGL